MVNDHRYTLVKTSEWPPERYSDSEAGEGDSSDPHSDSDSSTARLGLERDKVRVKGRGRARGGGGSGGRGMTPAATAAPPMSVSITTASTSSAPIRRWRLLPGRNKHLCDGRIIMAKQMGVFYFTVGLIVVTSGLFFGFDCPYLAQNVSPVLPVVGGIMFVFVLSALFRTSFMDPGIIPRADSEEARDIEKQIEVQNGINSPTYRPPPRTKEVVVNKVTVKLKYCFTCKIFRPPRASHCSICDNCVERFDHHCPWVGNCVGKRNYRFFYLFIVSLGFYCMFIFACVITHLALLVYEKQQRFLDAIQETPASLLVAIVCFLSVWSILGLAGFHTYLIFSNQTTNEDIKGSFSSRRGVEVRNPYSRPGFCGNCADILCGPFHPSLLRRRDLVSPDEVRLNEAALKNLDREMGHSFPSTAAMAAATPPPAPGGVVGGGPGSPTGRMNVNRASYGTADGGDPALRSPMNGSAAQSPGQLQSPTGSAAGTGAGPNQKIPGQGHALGQGHAQGQGQGQKPGNPTPKRYRSAVAAGGVSRSPKREPSLTQSQWLSSSTHPLLGPGEAPPTFDSSADVFGGGNPESVLDSLDLDSLDGSGSGGATTLSSGSQAGLIIKNSHII